MLTIGDLQALTGTSRRFIEQHIKAGNISSIRIGRRMIRVRRNELARWLAAHENNGQTDSTAAQGAANSTGGRS